MSAKVNLPEPLNKLLRSQLETAIYESALHRDDELIARRRIIDKWGQIDVAANLGGIVERWPPTKSTYSRECPKLLDSSTQIKHKSCITPTGSAPSRGYFMRQYRHGGREDAGLVHVAALLTDSVFLWTRTCLR